MIKGFVAAVLCVGLLLGAAEVSSDAYYYLRYGSFDGYIPEGHGDDIIYTSIVNSARNDRISGDLFLYEQKDKISIYEKLLPWFVSRISLLTGIPAHLMPAASDIVFPLIQIAFLTLLFRTLYKEPLVALFLAVAFYVGFPVLMQLYTPVRNLILGGGEVYLPGLRAFATGHSLSRFFTPQYTHVFFLISVIGILNLATTKRTRLPVYLGVFSGLMFYIRVYDAIVLGNLYVLTALYYLIIKDKDTAKRVLVAFIVFCITASWYLYEHFFVARSVFYNQFIERVIIDVVGHSFDFRRFAAFLGVTAAMAALYFPTVYRKAENKRKACVFFLLLPASWLPYFINVLIGINIQRTHWLANHILPVVTVMFAMACVPYIRNRKVLIGGMALMISFVFATRVLPLAEHLDRFHIPDGLTASLELMRSQTHPDEVLLASVFPPIQTTYSDNWSFMPFAAYSTAEHYEIFERYLWYKKLYLGERFGERVHDLLKDPIRPIDYMQDRPIGADFAEVFNEYNQIFLVYIRGYQLDPRYMDLLSYATRYEPEWVERIKNLEGPLFYLPTKERTLLAKINEVPLDPETILGDMGKRYKLDYLLFTPGDIRMMGPEWWERVRASEQLQPFSEIDGYHIFRFAPR